MRGKGRELSLRAQVGIAFVAASIAAVSVLVFSAAGLAAAVPSLTTTGTTLFTNGEPNPTGVATARCVNGGTLYTLHFSGLNQKAVYTVWGITFTDGPNGFAVGSLGRPDGSQNVFHASASGEAQFSLLVPAGGPTSFGVLGVDVGDSGTWPACMIGHGLLIVDGHTDGKTHGGVPGSNYPTDPFADSYDLMEFDLF
jgi:hypothetical protein